MFVQPIVVGSLDTHLVLSPHILLQTSSKYIYLLCKKSAELYQLLSVKNKIKHIMDKWKLCGHCFPGSRVDRRQQIISLKKCMHFFLCIFTHAVSFVSLGQVIFSRYANNSDHMNDYYSKKKIMTIHVYKRRIQLLSIRQGSQADDWCPIIVIISWFANPSSI